MTAGKFFLGIDAGQTTVKAVLYDDQLTAVALARGKSPNFQPHERMVERSHDDLWAAAADAISGALVASGIEAGDIAGIGITGHGDGLHLVDSAGRAVGPAIMAVDSRAWREREEILDDAHCSALILRHSGQVPFLGSPGILLRWMATHRPQDLDAAAAFLSCKDIIRLRLTGEISTDYSDASASFLETDTAVWNPKIMAAYGLAGYEHLLPALHYSSDVVGRVTAAAAARTGLAAGTPVVAGCHDVHSATVGLGALRENALVLVAGSFSINGVVTRENHTDPRWQSRLSVTPGLRIAMSTSATSTTTLEWMMANLRIHTDAQRDELFAAAAKIVPGRDYPAMTPYVFASPFGEKPSGSVVGLRNWHHPADLLRVTLDAIAYMHFWHTSALADAFSWSPTIRLGGGLARSPLYSQIVADALDQTIEVVSQDEAGAFGAAALAAAGVGWIDSPEDSAPWVHVERVHTPSRDGRDYWRDRIVKFRLLHEQLEPIWAHWSDGTSEDIRP